MRNAVADETGKAARWFHFAVAMIWEKARLGKRRGLGKGAAWEKDSHHLAALCFTGFGVITPSY
ncbi:hypothetical protein AGR4A_Cc190181 [Agrobacterium tumefaciens str. B6]|uniref:Uncharacterized protein n=1 Tax=Agrobacterium tumefaciens str. B6 TaxID=1183423 RepID=A0A822UZC4_AGRTU|nr:hypothetical protein AGR4A_Cc190181 [Agrobacterium tumefaciens str. B6]